MSSTSTQVPKNLKEKFTEILNTPYLYWINIVLLFCFASICVAIGSVEVLEIKNGLEIGEQICQAIFLLLFFIKLLSYQSHGKLWLIADALSVMATFLGVYI